MPSGVTCPSCQARLRVGANLAGKTVACPQCGNNLVIPKGPPQPAAAPVLPFDQSKLFRKRMVWAGVVGILVVLTFLAGTLHLVVDDWDDPLIESDAPPYATKVSGTGGDESGAIASEGTSELRINEDKAGGYAFTLLAVAWIVIVVGLFRRRLWAYHVALILGSLQFLAAVAVAVLWKGFFRLGTAEALPVAAVIAAGLMAITIGWVSNRDQAGQPSS